MRFPKRTSSMLKGGGRPAPKLVVSVPIPTLKRPASRKHPSFGEFRRGVFSCLVMFKSSFLLSIDGRRTTTMTDTTTTRQRRPTATGTKFKNGLAEKRVVRARAHANRTTPSDRLILSRVVRVFGINNMFGWFVRSARSVFVFRSFVWLNLRFGGPFGR